MKRFLSLLATVVLVLQSMATSLVYAMEADGANPSEESDSVSAVETVVVDDETAEGDNNEVVDESTNSEVTVTETDEVEGLDNVGDQESTSSDESDEKVEEVVENETPVAEESVVESEEKVEGKVEGVVEEKELPVVEKSETTVVEEVEVDLDEDVSVFEDGDPVDVVYDGVIANFGMKKSVLRVASASSESTMTSKEFDAIWSDAVECGYVPEPFCVFGPKTQSVDKTFDELEPGEVQVRKIVQATANTGEYQVSIQVRGKADMAKQNACAVVLFDRSGSMKNTSTSSKWDNAVQGAKDFAENLLKEDAFPNAYVGLVTFGSDAKVSRELKKSINLNKADFGEAKGGTNVHLGLMKAEEILNSKSECNGTGIQKFIVLVSDGTPTFYQSGSTTYAGWDVTEQKNTDTEHVCKYYNGEIHKKECRTGSKPSTVAINYADSIKGITILSIGYSVTSDTAKILQDIATKPEYYSDADPETIAAAFDTILSSIKLAGKNAQLEDDLGAVSLNHGETNHYIEQITEEGIVVSFTVVIDPNSEDEYQPTNGEVKLSYEDEDGVAQTPITISKEESAKVFWQPDPCEGTFETEVGVIKGGIKVTRAWVDSVLSMTSPESWTYNQNSRELNSCEWKCDAERGYVRDGNKNACKLGNHTVVVEPNCSEGEDCENIEEEVEHGGKYILPTLERKYILTYQENNKVESKITPNPVTAEATLLGYCKNTTDCADKIPAETEVEVTADVTYYAVWDDTGLTLEVEKGGDYQDAAYLYAFEDWKNSNKEDIEAGIELKLVKDETLDAQYRLSGCASGYHLNEKNNTCDLNILVSVSCEPLDVDNAKPVVSTFTSVWSGNSYTTAPEWSMNGSECTYDCKDGFHTENMKDCIGNTTGVTCGRVEVEHGESIEAIVEINWNGKTWENVPSCVVKCDTGYRLNVTENGTTCEPEILEEQSCGEFNIENAKVVNGTFTSQWTENGYTVAPEWSMDGESCTYECKEGFHSEDRKTCVSNKKYVECETGEIANGEYVVERVEIEWNNGWPTTPACTQIKCDDTYHEVETEGVKSCELNVYTITWNNDDGTKNEETYVNHGVVPEHEAIEKVNPLTGHIYTWNGWTPVPVAATEDTGYTATFADKCDLNYHDKNLEVIILDGTAALPNGNYDIGETTSVELECVPNTKVVQCMRGRVTNADYIVTGVNILWDVNDNAWEETPICDFTCAKGYKLNADKTECVKKPGGGGSSGGGKPDEEEIELGGEVSDKCSVSGSNLSPEVIAAYLYACENDITTIRDINEARLGDFLTRAEMAKIVSVFATKELGMKPNTSKDCSNFEGSMNGYSQEMRDYMVMSCQLELMGIHTVNYEAIPDFMPNKRVSRAEFGTILSRILWGDSYEGTNSNYYVNHLNALKESNIITNIDPNITEYRSWVLLMIYRSVNVIKAGGTKKAESVEQDVNNELKDDENGAFIGLANPASAFCVEQGGENYVVKDAEGNEIGLCKLTDGTVVDEWEYYRNMNDSEKSKDADAETTTSDSQEESTEETNSETAASDSQEESTEETNSETVTPDSQEEPTEKATTDETSGS